MTEVANQTRSMRAAAVVFIATWALHTADHVRRTTELTPDGVVWAGTVAAIVASVALTLIFVDHPLAPFAAAVGFTSLAFGTAASHLAPDWGYFSEPLLFGPATDRLALFAAVPEIAAALWLGWLGFRIVRSNNFQVAPEPLT